MADAALKYNLAFSLLRKLCQEEKANFVISPLSVGTALAMLTAGLRGETKTELLNLFGTLDENALHSSYSDLLSKKDFRDLSLKIVNRYLTDQDCEVHESFDSLLKEKYDTEVERVNFAENARQIEANVNAWVAKNTNNVIPQILPRGSLSGDTILVLLNALYFKGSWSYPPFESVPELKGFKLRSGEEVQRSFMTKSSESLEYGETDKLRIVKIPYEEYGYYMLVAIPKNENEYIADVIARAQTTELIRALKSPSSCDEVIFSMPKFRMEFDYGRVKENLEDLGVSKIFAPDVGDFGNLFSKAKRSPYVDAIIHKAVIEVDEMGTMAAACTDMSLDGSLSCFSPPIVVEVNRPFCFMIMSPIDTVCFAGICADP